MNKVYFDNLQTIVINNLLSAKNSVKISVAWLNFDIYGTAFKSLLENGVKIKIIIDDNISNARYNNTIDYLCSLGAKIKKIKMPGEKQIMHHKFCIIDNTISLSGSFNWTINAELNNYENLIVSDDINIILGFKNEFKSVWHLSTQDVKMLQKPLLCTSCRTPIIIICVFSQEGYYNTQVDIYEVCQCDFKFVDSEFFDICVYNNLLSIFNKYSDMDEYDYQMGIDCSKEEKDTRNELMNYEIQKYLSSIRSNRMGYPIIHAVGVYAQNLITKYDEERYIKILWKEKYISSIIEDEYPLP